MSRLIIVLLNPGFSFTNLKSIQNELNPMIQQIIPENCSNQPCPYLTDGDELGERILIFQSQDFLIEEYKADDDCVYRRMVLTKNLNQIQSQFRMKYEAISEAGLEGKKNNMGKSLLPEKEGMKVCVDQSYLDFECHKLMVVGMALLDSIFLPRKTKVLILGGGLCALSCFLFAHFPNLILETIEIDPTILELASKTFDLPQNHSDFQLLCSDAFEFINKKSEKILSEKNNKAEECKEEMSNDLYDLIIIDINSSDPDQISPPEKFLSKEFLGKLKNCLAKKGMLFLNFISKEEKTLQSTIEKIAMDFNVVYSARIENEYNTVIFAKNLQFESQLKGEEEEKILIVEEENVLDKKAIEINYKSLLKGVKKQWDQTLNLEELVGLINLQHPKIGKNPFEKTSAHVVDLNENLTNNTKEMYIKDLEKVNKKKKKKKNKNR